MKIVISGAGGFLGKELLNLLAVTDTVNFVVALDIRLEHIMKYRENPKFTLLTNEDFLRSDLDLSGFTLINLAYARSSDFASVKCSCEWTFALLRKLENGGCKRYINISSQSVYDTLRKSPSKETDLPRVSELYDMGKYYLENWIREFALKHDANYINLRPSSLTGPDFPQRITSRLLKSALENKEISINLNGQIFSYTHVKDMARALIVAAELENESDWNTVYNVGSEERYTIESIAQCVEDVFAKTDLDLRINRVPAESNYVNNSIDSSSFRQATGWTAERSLYDIVEEEFYEQLRKRDD